MVSFVLLLSTPTRFSFPTHVRNFPALFSSIYACVCPQTFGLALAVSGVLSVVKVISILVRRATPGEVVRICKCSVTLPTVGLGPWTLGTTRHIWNWFSNPESMQEITYFVLSYPANQPLYDLFAQLDQTPLTLDTRLCDALSNACLSARGS